jgi:transposase InsO family protein
MDFMTDTRADGRCFRTLNIVDDFTRERVAIEVDRSLPGARVVRVLQRLDETLGLPSILVSDNGLSQKSRRHSFSDLAFTSAETRTTSKRLPPSADNTLIIVTKGRVRTRPTRASYSVGIQAEGPSIIHEVVGDASTDRHEGIRPPGLVASGKRR